jgi:PGF-pre-PGF domain-containing protein
MKFIQIVRTKNRIKFSDLILCLGLFFLLAGIIIPTSAAGINAIREISPGTVYAGGTFTVTVHIKTDQHIEALTLDENLPKGWNLSRMGNDGAVFQEISTFKESTQEWIWTENLSAGEVKTVIYNVNVPSTYGPGVSKISGTVSAYSISTSLILGSSVINITSPPPNAEFSASPRSGSIPLLVQFTDLSTNSPNSWEWDFDGNGIVDSKEKNPVYTYENPGTYTVVLKAVNGTYGNDTETKTGYITVTEVLSSSERSGGGGGGGGSSGSGGGGGGGSASPESSTNIELKEISNEQVFKGIHTCYTFKGKANDIVSVEFDPKRTFGKTTAIVEILKNTSSIVKAPASGEVYKNINIWVGNSGFSSPDNLENAKISFKVNKTWILEHKIDKNKITLYRYTQDNWNSLSTIQKGEDKDYLYFTAETPGFSPFAILSNENNKLAENLQAKKEKNQTSNLSARKEGNSSLDNKDANKKLPDMGYVLSAAYVLITYAILKRRR